jgi:hypothetical protein
MTTNGQTLAVVAMLLFLALCFPLSAAPPDVPLYRYPAYTPGYCCSPWYAADADFNGDGNQDLVVGVYCCFEVYVLLGRGNGLFDATVYPVVNSMFPVSVAVADLDSDGALDLAAANFFEGPSDFAVFKGDGNGGFGSAAYFPGAGSFVTTGDFNEDDHIDLLFPGMLTLNQGDGTFADPVSVPSTSDDGYSVAVADFNGDGKDDYATTRDVYLGDGTGAFTPSFALPTGEFDIWVTAGDLSGDEIPDVVVGFHEGHEIAVVLGNGDGTFGSEQRYSVSEGPRTITIADVDQDGLTDVVVATYWAEQSASVLYGSGGGSLDPAVNVGPGIGTHYLAVADFDKDGLNDLAETRYTMSISMALADGPRSFPGNLRLDTGDGPWPRRLAVAIGDVNGDGRADLARANELSDDVSVLVGNGAATFAPEIRIPVGNQPSSLVFAEFTSDAHLDLAVANKASSDLSIFAGNGDGTFALVGSPAVDRPPSSVASGDLNDDAKADLVVASTSSSFVLAFLGQGDGTFTDAPSTHVGTAPVDLALGDLDGDKQLDLVTVHDSDGDVRILLGDGNGTFTPAPGPYIYPAGDQPATVEVADLNLDDDLDFAIQSEDGTYVYLGNGDGTFAAGTLYPSHEGRSVFAADADGDGLPDLIRQRHTQFEVLRGNGDGTFGGASEYYMPETPVLAGDFDLDGRVDVVGESGSHLGIALNQSGPKAFGFLADGTTLAWPSVLGALRYDIYRGDLSELVDLNGDGLPDNGYGTCMTGLDDDPRDTFFADPDVPSSGDGFFYLMSVVDAGGDGGLGTTSEGLPRVPAVACP